MMTLNDTAPPIPFGTPSELLDDGISLLRDLIRIDTTNPPGNEVLAAEYAERRLAEVGIAVEHFEPAPGRRSILARLGPGTRDGLALSAHLDVVPADASKWRHPPFAAVEDEGCIWGRGTIDMKHMAAYGLAVLRHLARTRARLARPLSLLLVADEEAGCALGSLAVARERPEWLAASAALTEVGGFTTWVDGHRVYPVQVAEKGFVWLRLTIHGQPGHGSMPREDSALIELARLVQVFAAQPFPFRATAPAIGFIQGIADVLGFPKASIFRAIGSPLLSDFVLDKLVRDPDRTRVFRALLRDTIAPTMVQAGDKANVIPGTASLTIDCRILPGTDIDRFINELRQRVPGRYDLEILASGPAVVMQQDHPILAQIRTVVEEADPSAVVVPSMLTGFTDARAFSEVGVPCYGFAPIWLPPTLNFAAMFHGHDERIPIFGFRWGLATLYELTRRVLQVRA